jgi:hypothetical protein
MRGGALAASLFALWLAPPVAAQEWRAGPASAEARYTGGSDGYTRPYASFDFQTDQLYKNDWTAKLGAEQDIGPFWSAHADLGILQGELRDAGNSGGGYLFDFGVDHRVLFWRFGGVYNVSRSQVEPVGSPRDVERQSLLVAEQQAAASGNGVEAPNSFWFHEASVYAAGPLPGALRILSLGFAAAAWARLDDNATGLAERADLNLQLGSSWSLSGGVSFEQPFASGDKTALYETVAIKYRVPTVLPGLFDIKD